MVRPDVVAAANAGLDPRTISADKTVIEVVVGENGPGAAALGNIDFVRYHRYAVLNQNFTRKPSERNVVATAAWYGICRLVDVDLFQLIAERILYIDSPMASST